MPGTLSEILHIVHTKEKLGDPLEALGMTFGDKNSDFYFFSPNIRYEVTNFQRAYTWNKYQIGGFIDDLKYMRDNNTSIGWPSILLQESKTASPNVSTYLIGDGQQRITTVSLALLAIGHVYKRELEKSYHTPEEAKFYKNLLEGESPDSPGLLASHSISATGSKIIEPILSFYSEKTNEAFREIFLNISFIDDRLALVNDAEYSRLWESEENLKNNFTQLFMFFFESTEHGNNLDILEEYAEIILKQIKLSALIYSPSENMQRSFSRMNSFGKVLTPEELIKAEIYGEVRKKDEKLAEEIVEYWTNTLESGKWFNTNYTASKNLASGGNNSSSYLEKFLSELSIIYTDFEDHIKRYAQVKHPHWLKDRWLEILNSKSASEYAELWKEFKEYQEIFEIIQDDEANYTVGSLQWEINYTAHILNGMHYHAIIMKIAKCSESEEDAIKNLILLRKIYFYTVFIDNNKNWQYRVVRSGSPIVNKTLSNKELIRFIESPIASGNHWLNEKRIARRLELRDYSNKESSDLNDLFIHIANEESRLEGKISTMFNPRSLNNHGAKEGITREHILPQVSNKNMTDEELYEYNMYISKIGNSIPIPRSINSSAGNTSFVDKFKKYRKNTAGWGVYWSNGLQEIIDELGDDWGYEHILLRSSRVSSLIAKHLSTDNPHNDFEEFDGLFDPGYKFSTSLDSYTKTFTLKEDGSLLSLSGRPVLTIQELIEETGNDIKSKRSTIHLKDLHDEPSGTIKVQSGKVEFSLDGFKVKKVYAESEMFGSYVDQSAKEFFENYIRSAYSKDSIATRIGLNEAKAVLRTDEKYKDHQHFSEIEEGLYVRNTLTQHAIEEIVNIVSEKINDIIEIDWA